MDRHPDLALVQPVSIHAPREGSDRCLRRRGARRRTFQSTPPVRGATTRARLLRQVTLFQSTPPVRGATAFEVGFLSGFAVSIHAPREGSDFGEILIPDQLQVSIHAPREGSDPSSHTLIARTTSFNPRPP